MKKLPKERRLLEAEAAQLYLLSDPPLTQSEIAHKLGVNKATISRLLRSARERGLVKVSLNLPREQALELALVREFNLTEAVVVPVRPPARGRDYDVFRRLLAEAAARYLESEGSPLKDNQRIAISCGATMRELVNALTPRRYTGMRISPLTVETEPDWLVDSSPFTLVGVLYGKWGVCDCDVPEVVATDSPNVLALHPLPGTLLSGDGAKFTDQYERFHQEIRKMAESADVALIGISSCELEYGGGTFVQILKRNGIASNVLTSKGVVGEVCNRPYNGDGEDLYDDIPGLSAFMDGVSLDTLRRRVENGGKVVAIAGGVRKSKAIRVALKSKIANLLITDSKTAESVLVE